MTLRLRTSCISLNSSLTFAVFLSPYTFVQYFTSYVGSDVVQGGVALAHGHKLTRSAMTRSVPYIRVATHPENVTCDRCNFTFVA
jgi:hypothetical protein